MKTLKLKVVVVMIFFSFAIVANPSYGQKLRIKNILGGFSASAAFRTHTKSRLTQSKLSERSGCFASGAEHKKRVTHALDHCMGRTREKEKSRLANRDARSASEREREMIT